jgi:hypothetical protein
MVSLYGFLKIVVDLTFKICDMYVIKIVSLLFHLKRPTDHVVHHHRPQFEKYWSRPFHFSSTFLFSFKNFLSQHCLIHFNHVPQQLLSSPS